jgi:hypothetical protein
LSLPGSFSYSLINLFDKDAFKVLNIENKRNVFVGNNELESRRAAIIAEKLGFSNSEFLKGGMNEFKEKIIEFKKPEKTESMSAEDTYRFRERARIIIPALIEKNKMKIIPKKESKRIIGGC